MWVQLKKINVPCVETVDVCTCKFGLCGTKDHGKWFQKKVQYDTKIYCVLSLCFVNEDWKSWYIQYLLLLVIENILVMLKRCCIYFTWELFIMLGFALLCHLSSSMKKMINHNGNKTWRKKSNVMICITQHEVNNSEFFFKLSVGHTLQR